MVVNQLWYQQSSLLTNNALSEEGGEGVNIPVGEIVNSNIGNENKVNAKYRLIVFPTYVSSSNEYVGYKIRWSIFEASTAQRLWTSTSWVSNPRGYAEIGMSEKRAKLLVEGLLSELENAEVIKPLPNKT